MMCRRIHELLSAYIDGELSESESFRVQEHLDRCACCCEELESLRQTKLLLGALARQRSRGELERLLLIEARRAEMRPPSPWDGLRRFADTPIRPRVALATAALSLTALWAATTRLTPSDEEMRPGALLSITPVYNRQGERVGNVFLFATRPSPAPRGPLPEPPRSRFLPSSSPDLLTASWTYEPRYEARHFTASYPGPTMDDASLLCCPH